MFNISSCCDVSTFKFIFTNIHIYGLLFRLVKQEMPIIFNVIEDSPIELNIMAFEN